jgi:hypothetical protein
MASMTVKNQKSIYSFCIISYILLKHLYKLRKAKGIVRLSVFTNTNYLV